MQPSSFASPVPELTIEAFINWINDPKQPSKPLMEIGDYQRIQVQRLEDIYRYVSVAVDSGHSWMLLDGPKQQRPYWLLDPWWKNRPEMTEKLQKMSQSHCVNSHNLINFFEEHFFIKQDSSQARDI